MSELNAILRNRSDTEENWNTNSTVILAQGEIGVVFTESEGTKIKIGDGVTSFAQLPYFGAGGGSGGGGGNIVISPTQPSGQSEGDFWYKEL